MDLLEFFDLIKIILLCIVIIVLMWAEIRRHNNWYDSFMYKRCRDMIKNVTSDDMMGVIDYSPRSFKLKRNKKADSDGQS